MLRLILLLSPIFVSFFWSLILFNCDDNHKKQKNMLGIFMLLTFIVFSCQFIYFRPYPNLYVYFNFPLRLAALMSYPVFYIYFRMITVDSSFSFRAHWPYFIVQTIVILLYGIAIALTPKNEFSVWLYDMNAFKDSNNIKFLNIAARIVQLTFLVQVITIIIANFVLIKKYKAKAELFYSNIWHDKIDKTLIIGISITLMSISAFVLIALGQNFLMYQEKIMNTGWFVIAVTVFIIGFMGSQQKNIIVNFEEEESADNGEDVVDGRDVNTILEKLLLEFENNKIFLNSQLNINDVASIVGTNRTYISVLINQNYELNFSAFVNKYRFEELERLIEHDPNLANEALIERCGFGSFNSMKRVVMHYANLPFNEWKKNKTDSITSN